jgi:glyoxylase-like metal-dependent hydrolase (beta-lactamase superfamily II)/8-oxo-dGTP pyrophosphatase MutT (NUDIX family)
MVKVRPAAGILPLRRSPEGWSVFLVQRGRAGRFFPGFHAFPGGAMEDDDDHHGLCAARELWEETGLWVGPRQPPAEIRREFLEGKRTWPQVLLDYPLALEALRPAGIRTTPDYAVVRFRAQFFAWDCPLTQQAEVWPGELEHGAWWSVTDALEAWRQGRIFLAAPTQDSLHALAQSPDWDPVCQLLCSFAEDTRDPIRLRPGLAYIPLCTPTLPPARHTMCYLLGEQNVIVVDPGASDPQQLERIERVLQGRAVQAVLCTHHHGDHVGGLDWCVERGWPIWAHAKTAALLSHIPVARHLQDGETIAGWQVLHTPGHASGHLALWEAETGILLCGDLVSSISTILIPPPDGDMGDYLNSLRRCRQLRPRLVLPSHGGPFGPDSDLLGKTLQHRLEREAKVVEALGRPFGEILERAYADVAGPARKMAEMSLQAHLHKLEKEGLAQRREDAWFPA